MTSKRIYLDDRNRTRKGIRPIHLEDIYQYWLSAIKSPWVWTEVLMGKDLEDWERLDKFSRRIFSRILRGFTLSEIFIGCFWRDVPAKYIGDWEVVSFATEASAQEQIHGGGYDYLESSLGLDTNQEAYALGSASREKLVTVETLLEADIRAAQVAASKGDEEGLTYLLAETIAIFSGGYEGLSLFGSFMTLMTFTQANYFSGVHQILTWSMLDETLHAMAGFAIYRRLMAKLPLEGQTKVKSISLKMIDCIRDAEIAFLEECFEGCNSEIVSLEKAIAFIWHRYQEVCEQLEIEPNPVPDDLVDIEEDKQLFYSSIKGISFNDFFASLRNGAGYEAVVEYDWAHPDKAKILEYLNAAQR